MKHLLHGQWTLSFLHPTEKRQIVDTASVPGNIEPELQRMGLLGDYMPPDEKFATADFDLTDWTYRYVFDAPPLQEGYTRELVFEGIDTVATVRLNGETVLECANMHRTYRIPIDSAHPLLETGNAIEVTIRSAELYARHREGDAFAMQRPGSLCEGNLHLRKARYCWGWDHAPRLRTSGIFRPVYLEDLPAERFTGAYLFTRSITDTEAKLGFRWEYTLPDTVVMRDYVIRYTLFSDGEIAYTNEETVYFPRGVLHMTVPLDRIRLWWPFGYGDSHLCDFKLEMLRGGRKLAEWNSKWGIRTVRFFESEAVDADGNGEFRFVVNNEEIFARGTNWKPLDPLPSRADAKVEKALQLVTDLNCNMVRIWGGGFYEEHPFFDYCDAHGILVWHDFMFACEVPTRDDAYCEEVKKEAREIVKKLRNHPSLAIWCGDNENDQNFTWAHGDGTALPSDQRISREILRNAVLDYDPYRAYVASSPRMPDSVILERRRGLSVHQPLEKHLYKHDSFTGGKSLRSLKAFFLGEVGPHAAPPVSIYDDVFLRERARCERLWDVPVDPRVRCTDIHQDDSYFIRWRQVGKQVVSEWFDREFSVSEWRDFAIALNVAGGEVFKDTVEFCRVTRPKKTGILWWSLLDMWPMIFNFSVVDSAFRPKLPYYWLKQSQQSFALIVCRERFEGPIALYAANETLETHSGTYRITAVAEDGSERIAAEGSYCSQRNAASTLAFPKERETRELWLIEWSENGKTGKNHFVTGKRPYDLDAYRMWLDRIDTFYGVPKTY